MGRAGQQDAPARDRAGVADERRLGGAAEDGCRHDGAGRCEDGCAPPRGRRAGRGGAGRSAPVRRGGAATGWSSATSFTGALLGLGRVVAAVSDRCRGCRPEPVRRRPARRRPPRPAGRPGCAARRRTSVAVVASTGTSKTSVPDSCVPGGSSSPGSTSLCGACAVPPSGVRRKRSAAYSRVASSSARSVTSTEMRRSSSATGSLSAPMPGMACCARAADTTASTCATPPTRPTSPGPAGVTARRDGRQRPQGSRPARRRRRRGRPTVSRARSGGRADGAAPTRAGGDRAAARALAPSAGPVGRARPLEHCDVHVSSSLSVREVPGRGPHEGAGPP